MSACVCASKHVCYLQLFLQTFFFFISLSAPLLLKALLVLSIFAV